MKTRNSEALDSFVKYCEEHPDERFWQALLNWSEAPYILFSSTPDGKVAVKNTFYLEGRNS